MKAMIVPVELTAKQVLLVKEKRALWREWLELYEKANALPSGKRGEIYAEMDRIKEARDGIALQLCLILEDAVERAGGDV